MFGSLEIFVLLTIFASGVVAAVYLALALLRNSRGR